MNKIKKSEQKSFYEKMIFAVMMLILAITPYFRGLFFDIDYTKIIFFITLVFIMYMISTYSKNKNLQLTTVVDFCVILLPIVYLIPMLVGKAAYMKEAMNSVLKAFAIVSVYFISKNYINQKKYRNIFLNAVLFSGWLAAIIGLGAMIGDISFNGAVVWGRINSVFQYANSMASYMLAMFIISFGMYQELRNKKWRFIYSISGYVFLLTLILTYSRGGLLLLPIAGLILVFGMTKEGILDSIGYLISSAIATAVVMIKWNSYLLEKQNVKMWGLLVLGAVVSVILSLIFEKINDKIPKVDDKKLKTIGIVILVIIILTVGYIGVTILKADNIADLDGTLISKAIPKFMLTRLIELDKDNANTMQRVYYYKDGIKIIKDNFFVGGGGGAWKELYKTYQSFAYGSTQAHNYLLQTQIETGILGSILMFGIIISILISGLKYIFKRENINNTNWAIYVAVVMLFIHSIMDFDFSLMSIAFVFYMLLGSWEKDYGLKKYSFNLKKWIIIALFIVPMMFSGIYSVVILKDEALKKEYLTAISENETQENTQAQINYLEKIESLSKYDSWKAQYSKDLGVYYGARYNSTEDISDKMKQGAYLEKGIKSKPYDMDLNKDMALYMISIGEFDRGFEYLDKMVKYANKVSMVYEIKIRVLIDIAKILEENQDMDGLLIVLDKIVKTEEDFNRAKEESIQKPMQLSEEINMMIANSKEVLKVLTEKE